MKTLNEIREDLIDQFNGEIAYCINHLMNVDNEHLNYSYWTGKAHTYQIVVDYLRRYFDAAQEED